MKKDYLDAKKELLEIIDNSNISDDEELVEEIVPVIDKMKNCLNCKYFDHAVCEKWALK